jgi:hypothetical protein
LGLAASPPPIYSGALTPPKSCSHTCPLVGIFLPCLVDPPHERLLRRSIVYHNHFVIEWCWIFLIPTIFRLEGPDCRFYSTSSLEVTSFAFASSLYCWSHIDLLCRCLLSHSIISIPIMPR